VAHDHDELGAQVLGRVFGRGDALQVRRIAGFADGEEAPGLLVEEQGIGHPAVRAGDDHGEGRLPAHQGRAHGGIMAGIQGADALPAHKPAIAGAELGEGRAGAVRRVGGGGRPVGRRSLSMGLDRDLRLGLGRRGGVLLGGQGEGGGGEEQGQEAHGNSRGPPLDRSGHRGA